MQGMITPEMLDAAVIQFRMLLDNDPTIPADVKETGLPFMNSLDKWSEKMKQEKVNA